MFPRRGEISKCALIDEDQAGFLCGTGCLKVQLPKRVLHPRFVYYYLGLRWVVEWLERNAIGTTMLNLNTGILGGVQVPVLALERQQRIADVLAAYDDLIENNRRRIALLEQSARLLYREWFVHLRFPGHEHVKVVDGVPEGWESRPLGKLYENLDRLRVPLSVLERDKRRGQYPYYGAAGVLDHIDGFLFDGRHLLMGEDGTVVTERGTPMLQLVGGRFWVNNHAHVMRAGIATVEFLYCALSEYQVRGHITGVAQPKITQKSMNRIPVLLPPESLRSEFQDVVVSMIDQRFKLQAYNEKLRQARDLLLPRLMSGQIQLNDTSYT